MATYLNAAAGRFGTPTNAKKYTISTWIKPAVEGNDTNNFFNYNYGSGKQAISIQVRNNDQTLRVNQYVPGTDTYDIRTNRAIRDPSAWYHIVIKYDSTQGSSSDRVKIYINGENQTSLAASSYPAQDADSFIADTPNNNKGINIGNQWDGSGNVSANSYYLGYMSQFIYTDGYSYDASSFGSTNANGIWIPNTSPSVSYGTNGFKLEFAGTGAAADASGFGADTSGNNNHLVSNSLGTNPSVKDTPQNNFVTWNSLANSSYSALSAGNLITTGNTATNNGNVDATVAPLGGKWYYEVKFVTAASSSSANYPNIGVYPVKYSRQPKNGGSIAEAGYFGDGCAFQPSGSKYRNNATASYGAAWSTNDIIGVALDMENFAVYYSINGTWQDSGDPTSGASKTGAAQAWTAAEGAYALQTSSYNNSVMQWNFGNPSFTVASTNADANGEGSFEYAVPSGYYALCTNNLALYGG